MPKVPSISRRRFAQLAGVSAATLLARPAAGWSSGVYPGKPMRAGGTVVRLNSNENPYGPSRHALKAMTDVFDLAWRYPDEHADALIETIAKTNGVNQDQ